MLRLRTFGGIALVAEHDLGDWSSRRRRLALLAVVAAAGPKGISRERLIAILWPDSPSDQARHALSQTLYALRRDLDGAEVLVTGPELRLDPTVLRSDIDQFREAIAARRWIEAADIYRGPFLDGFVLSDAPDFERWLDGERRHFEKEAMQALGNAVNEARAAGASGDVLELTKKMVAIDPLNGRATVDHMDALDAIGDRAGALGHARHHVDLVRRELESDPDPAVLRAIERLRAVPTPPAPIAPPQSHRVSVPTAAEPPSIPARTRHRGRVAVMAVALSLVVVAVTLLRRRTAESLPVLAVGEFTDVTGSDSTGAGVLGEILTTTLSRLGRLEVISTSRMLELLPRREIPDRATRLEAARRAGAQEILEGEISAAEGLFRLDLRRIDLAAGTVRRGYRVAARDRWALADSVTVAIAADLALERPSARLTGPLRSPTALRLYDEGLRALYQYDTYAAARIFRSALEEDSTFAMAAYFAWWSAQRVGDTAVGALRSTTLRLADQSGPRERLLIRAHIGAIDNDLRSIGAADSLATGYPRDPEALTRAAGVYAMTGAPVERTVALLERAIAIDSVAEGGKTGPCRLCEIFAQLADVYLWADSVDARDRTVTRWIRTLPNDPQGYAAATEIAVRRGRDADAARTRARYLELSRRPADPVIEALTVGILRSDPAAITRGCTEAFAPTVSSADWARYRWYCAIALRTMGKFRAATALVRDGRAPFGAGQRFGVEPDALLTAVLDFESGRPRLMSAFFLAAARRAAVDSSSVGARQVAWDLVLAATAAVAAEDTVSASRLADSIATYGRRSASSRDPLLHHFIRGLLLADVGRHPEAVEEYRAAVNSWPQGYTRINYELAASALAMNRPRDAIYPLQAALRGGFEGPQLYLNRTAIHERLAEAFDRAGDTDSAAAHFQVVARMWRDGDPSVAERFQAAKGWLERHGRRVE